MHKERNLSPKSRDRSVYIRIFSCDVIFLISLQFGFFFFELSGFSFDKTVSIKCDELNYLNGQT